MKPKKDRKKLKDTAVGKWVKENLPGVADGILEAAADVTGVGFLRDIIKSNESKLSPEQKQEFDRLAFQHLVQMETERTTRWSMDMTSDSWLSKNIRPLVLAAFTFAFFLFFALDSMEIRFQPSKEIWDIFKIAFLSILNGYFVIRGIEKVQEIRSK